MPSRHLQLQSFNSSFIKPESGRDCGARASLMIRSNLVIKAERSKPEGTGTAGKAEASQNRAVQ